MENFGKRLAILIKELNITQKEFANSINVSATAIGNYLKRNRTPNGDILTLINKRYNASIDWLLTGKGDMLKKEELFAEEPTAKYEKDKDYAFQLQRKYIDKLEKELTDLKKELHTCNLRENIIKK